jgi:hypothetical protein
MSMSVSIIFLFVLLVSLLKIKIMKTHIYRKKYFLFNLILIIRKTGRSIIDSDIPLRNDSPESCLRDPRMLWAPAISISGKNDQPLITPQYQKKEQRIAEHKLPISFLPHKIISSKRLLSIIQRGKIYDIYMY